MSDDVVKNAAYAMGGPGGGYIRELEAEIANLRQHILELEDLDRNFADMQAARDAEIEHLRAELTAERERCAKIAQGYASKHAHELASMNITNIGWSIAAAIRKGE